MENIARPVPPIGEKPKDDPKVISERNWNDYSAIWLINAKISMVGAGILDDAHHAKEIRENRVKAISPISIVLFCLGVVVTIVSRLFGVEGGGVAE
jgi:hypothetical protein